ncbi:MAG: metallophosphoesterase family protein, partial [Clostridia bacterium]|nr:metallophosphoesterase family protein [Clostridia bacterium]
MKKRILVFIVALISFFGAIPAYAQISPMDIVSFQEELCREIDKAEGILDRRFVRSGNERVTAIKGLTAVVGDLHGDLYTFRAIRDRLSRDLHEGRIKNVVFLGDIMDRGNHSAETLLELLEFFNEFPEQVYIIRGNHEDMSMFKYFRGDNPARDDPLFRDAKRGFGVDDNIEYRLGGFFNKLPYALVINGHTLAVHGGIPREDLQIKGFFGKGRFREGSKKADVAYSTEWADFSLHGGAKMMNMKRTLDDDRVILFSEGDVSKCFDRWRTYEKDYADITEALKYLVRAHQPELGSALHQSLSKIVTTVFSAIENQDGIFAYGGVSVALIVEEDMPPSEYFRVFPKSNGEGRECVDTPSPDSCHDCSCCGHCYEDSCSKSGSEEVGPCDVFNCGCSVLRIGEVVDPANIDNESDSDFERAQCCVSNIFKIMDTGSKSGSESAPMTEYYDTPSDAKSSPKPSVSGKTFDSNSYSDLDSDSDL